MGYGSNIPPIDAVLKDRHINPASVITVYDSRVNPDPHTGRPYDDMVVRLLYWILRRGPSSTSTSGDS
jgi:hypothetical protein